MYRTTTRHLRDISVEVMTHEHYRKGTQRFAPDRIREELRETDDPFGGDAHWSYEVTVAGYLLKKDGSVGQLGASMKYSAPSRQVGSSGGIELIPADIAALLLGADGLRDWQRPA